MLSQELLQKNIPTSHDTSHCRLASTCSSWTMRISVGLGPRSWSRNPGVLHMPNRSARQQLYPLHTVKPRSTSRNRYDLSWAIPSPNTCNSTTGKTNAIQRWLVSMLSVLLCGCFGSELHSSCRRIQLFLLWTQLLTNKRTMRTNTLSGIFYSTYLQDFAPCCGCHWINTELVQKHHTFALNPSNLKKYNLLMLQEYRG